MKYKYKRHEDGYYDVLDVPIFVENTRKMPDGTTVKWSKKDLEKLAGLQRSKEKRGIKPPIFVGHNGTRRGDEGSEDACGTMANIRCIDVEDSDKKVKAFLVCNMSGLDEYTFNRIKEERLIGRSVEIRKDLMRLTGLALLGRRAPHLEMPNESVTEHQESPYKYELYDEGKYAMNPAQAAPAAPAAPATPDIGAQLMPLLQQMMQICGGAGAPAPAAPAAPPAPAPAPAAKPQNFEAATPAEAAPAAVPASNLEVEKLKAENAYLQKALATTAAANAQNFELAATAARENALSSLKNSGKVVDVASFDDLTQKFGLDFAVSVASKVTSAPTSTNAPSIAAKAPSEVSTPNASLKTEALSYEAQIASDTWDLLPAASKERAEFNHSRDEFIAAALKFKI